MGKDFLNGPKPTEEKILYTLFGIIWDYESGEGEYGTYIKFRGDFEAFNHVDEKAFAAPFAIIPSPMDSILAGQVESVKQSLIDKETGEVLDDKPKFKFIIDVGYKPSDSPTGYEWMVRSRKKMEESNEMKSLKQEFLSLGQDG